MHRKGPEKSGSLTLRKLEFLKHISISTFWCDTPINIVSMECDMGNRGGHHLWSMGVMDRALS